MHEHKTAVITGASRGIGRAVALRLASSYRVVGLARSGDQLDTLATEIAQAGGHFQACVVDIRDGSAVERALKDVRCDVLINNAGVMHKKPFLELSSSEWHEMVDVNFNAIFHVTRALLPQMVARRDGHVINVASIAGRTAFVGGSCYAATKHALLGFSETLMLEVREFGVRVSSILPGSVATELTPGGSAKGWALKPDDVADCVEAILRMPARALLHTVEVRASNPGHN